MHIRRATESDIPALREVYRDAVISAPRGVYTDEQTRAWSRSADSAHLGEVMLGNITYLAEIDRRIVGFCTVQSDGRVALLYVHGSYGRRGVGSALLHWTLRRAELPSGTALSAEASEFSLPLFNRFGFELVETERTLWNGVEFLRYKVRKDA